MPDSHDPVCVLKPGRGPTANSHTHKHSLRVKICEALQCVIRGLGNPESLLVLLISWGGINRFFYAVSNQECVQQVPAEVSLMTLQK